MISKEHTTKKGNPAPQARQKAVMVKLLVDHSAEQSLRRLLRELSWTMEPASLGDLFLWIYTQAHLHKQLEKHIQETIEQDTKDAIRQSRKSPEKAAPVENRRTNFMTPASTAEWLLSVANCTQQQTASRLILHYAIENWEHIKKVTGWKPVFKDPDENLWTRFQ